MRVEREPVAFSVKDDLLAAEIHDAVWTGDEDFQEHGDFQQPDDRASHTEATRPSCDAAS